jgi:hypothetical protein
MSNIVKWTPNLAVTRRIEEALELVNTKVPAIRQEEKRPALGNSAPPAVDNGRRSPQLVAMLRACALVDKPYASYYVLGEDGRYRYSRSGQVNKAIFRELYSGFGVGSFRMRSADIDEETCPWCGSSGPGGVLCEACETFICWGAVVDNRFIRCRCGHSGELSKRTLENIGVVPRGR